MKTSSSQLSFEPFLENRRSLLLLRWLVIILAACLTLFSHLESEHFIGILALVVAFSLTNLAMGLLPLRLFVRARSNHWVTIADAVFLSSSLFVLRMDWGTVHLPLIGLFILTLIAKDLRIVLLSVLAVGVLFGAFAILVNYGLVPEGAVEQFLRLGLLFLVSTFYVFLTATFDRDTSSSTSILEEARNSEILVEMTRALSASLDPDEVYQVIVGRLGEVMDGVECSIVKLVADQVVFLATSETDEVPTPIPVVASGVLAKASEEKQTVLIDLNPQEASQFKGHGRHAMAIPMVSRGNVYGLIYFPGNGFELEPSSTTIHFLEVVAGTAANSLRNVQMLEDMKHLARTDFLTGLPNHRYFQAALAREVGRAHRHHHELSLLLIDLDFLKGVNDRFGHQTGDAVIRKVAKTIRDTCREIDFAARYGGEEFVVILPETDLPGAVLVAERIRRNIETAEIERVGTATASIGVANYPVNANTRDELIRIADQALYVAKDSGRNQVAHFRYQFATP